MFYRYGVRPRLTNRRAAPLMAGQPCLALVMTGRPVSRIVCSLRQAGADFYLGERRVTRGLPLRTHPKVRQRRRALEL